MKIQNKIKSNLTALWNIMKWLSWILITFGVVLGGVYLLVYLLKFIFD